MSAASHPAAMGADFGPEAGVDVPPGHALWVEIRSPDGPIWTGTARSVVVPATRGAMGILPRHASLLSSLEIGLTKVRAEDGTERRFVTGLGFVEVHRNRVLLLVDFGEEPEEIDIGRATAARDRARARLRRPSEDVDQVRAEASLRRALVRLRFAGQPRA